LLGLKFPTFFNAAKVEITNGSALQKESALKPELIAALDTALVSNADKPELDAPEIEAIIAQLENAIPESVAATSSIVPRFQQAIESLSEITAKLKLPDPADAEGVFDFVVKRLPKFVYYSNYGNLDSEIYLPHVVQNLAREDLGAREAAKARTLRVLFSFVRLQPNEILELGRDFRDPQGRQPTSAEIAEIATKKRERTILLNSAGRTSLRNSGTGGSKGITHSNSRRTAIISAFGLAMLGDLKKSNLKIAVLVYSGF